MINTAVSTLYSGGLVCPACTPVFHLFTPLLGMVLISWGATFIASGSTEKWKKIIELLCGLLCALVLVAVPISVPITGFVILYIYWQGLLSMNHILKQTTGKENVGMFFIFLLLPYFVILAASNAPAYKVMFGLSFFLKLSIAAVGLMWISTFVRKSGVDPDKRTAAMIFQGIILTAMIFVLLAMKLNFFYHGNVSLYMNVLKTRMDSVFVVFAVLAVGVGYFIVQEKRAAERLGAAAMR